LISLYRPFNIPSFIRNETKIHTQLFCYFPSHFLSKAKKKWTNLKKENIYHKNLHKMQTNREGLKLLSPPPSSSQTLGSLSLSLSLVRREAGAGKGMGNTAKN